MQLAKRIIAWLPALAAAVATLYNLFAIDGGLRAITGGEVIWLAYLLAMPAVALFGGWGALKGNRSSAALSAVLLGLGSVVGVFSFRWVSGPATALALVITILPLAVSDRKGPTLG